MSKDYLVDYLGCFLLKVFGPVFRKLPVAFSLFLGKRLGELFYYFDYKHRAIAYANIKVAFAAKLSPLQTKTLTKKFYRSFGENLIEIFFIPLINKQYIEKYITFEGLDNIAKGFKENKGVILLGIHAGSWELTNVICAHLGFPFSLLIRDQKYPRLDNLLNSYRINSGYKLIQRQNQTRQLIQALKNNEAIGMTVDQGGKTGILVKFFDKDASMAQGAVKLALKYGTTIITGFFTRIRGPYVKIIIGSPFEIKKTGNQDLDIYNNLQRLTNIFEKLIIKYPQEYFWSYKIWKYTKEKRILILTDNKTGHLKQSQAVAEIINRQLKDRGQTLAIDNVEVKFRNTFSKSALTLSSCLSGKYNCQGCLWCLKAFLEKETYNSLLKLKPDLVISCGSSLAPVNFIISRENSAKSIVIMRPAILGIGRFDLVIMPRHDHPPRKNNVIATDGALNMIDEEYLEYCASKIIPHIQINKKVVIGILVGGDTRDFKLSEELISETLKQAKVFCQKQDAQILITTSRRTSEAVTRLIKEEFKEYSRCRLMIIANENNIKETVGGILALSHILIVTPESISMISEAASSGRYVIVLESSVDRRHNYFLNYMAKQKYIYLSRPDKISGVMEKILDQRPQPKLLKDKMIILDALKKLI